MGEKILIGLIGAILALIIKEFLDRRKQIIKGRRIAALAVEHLEILRKDLTGHVMVNGGRAYFGETQYCEVAGADFLYTHITSNLECFKGVESVKNTILFFHHYKANIATIKVRLDGAESNVVTINEGTYTKLISSLGEAISELKGIASKRCVCS